MLTHFFHAYDLQLVIAKRLTDDIPEDQMCAQPHDLVNHPAWSLGHMITAAYSVGTAIGIEGSPPDGWTEIFKTGGTPSEDRSLFPSKAELLAELEKVHEIWKATLPTVASSVLDAEQPNENMRASFPTVGALIAFIMTSHEMDHLGQIAAWRRGAGLGPAK